MFEDKVLSLIDLALDLDDGKEEDIRKILENIKLTIEVGTIVAVGIERVIDAYKSPEKSDAERVQALIDLKNKAQALKAA